MAIELSTAGMTVKWAVEVTAGTRPTTGYSQIHGVKSIPEYNPEPSMLETTDLSQTEWKTYISGLKDPGSSMGLTCNFYETFKTDWEAMLTAYDTAKASGKAVWIEYTIPGNDSFYYRAIPSALGFSGANVDEVLEITAYLTPNGAPVWASASA